MIWLLHAYRVLRDSYLRFSDDDGVAMAGYIAFSGFLAIFPLLIFAVSLTGLLLGQEQSQAAVDALFQFTPEHVAQTLEPVLHDVMRNRGQGVLTIAVFATIWTASNAFEAFRNAFDRAYEVRGERFFLLNRLISIAFVFLGAIVAVVLGISVIFAPLLVQMADNWFEFTIPNSTAALSFILGITIFMLFLTMMHWFLPSKSMRGQRIWPGVVITLVIWLAGATAFSAYLSFAPTYAITYGALTGVIVTLLFFYLSGVAIIFGAEVNAVLNATEKPI